MIITPQIRLAIRVAATQHQGQLRHDGITPFIIHPIEVAAQLPLLKDFQKLFS